jgi:hypothetical protein
VIEAVRVPPSAWITSQSMVTERSPRAAMSTTERKLRPIRRWISCVRPEGPPRPVSRGMRFSVARGSIAYSAVTHPTPLFFKKDGTFSSTVAVHMTRVAPISISAAPSACFVYPVVIRTGRKSSRWRPSLRESFWFEFVISPYFHRLKMT